MAKVTDYNAVIAEITKQLETTDWSLVDLIGDELAIICVLNIYMTADSMKGFGQDFHTEVSVISSNRVISMIVRRHSSHYVPTGGVCQYENLAEDIENILISIQAVYDRIDFD